MIKILSFIGFLILLSFIVFSISSPHFNEENPDKLLHEKCIYPTVMLVNDTENSGASGFIVKSTKINDKFYNTVITASHALENKFSKIKVCNYLKSTIVNYDIYNSVSYANNSTYDIGICFFISDKLMPCAELSLTDSFYIGTKIFHVGYGFLDDSRCDFGTITQPFSFQPEVFKGSIRTNAHTVVGDSGGPLFLKSNYKVIGICKAIRQFQMMSVSGQSYYVNIDNLRIWNNEINNNLDFIYKLEAKLPELPFIELEMHQYQGD